MKPLRTFLAWLLLCCPLLAANELHWDYTTGSTLYAVIHNTAGQAWNGSAFATWTPNANRDSYDVPIAEVSTSGFYAASFPAGATGQVSWDIYVQAGGSPDAAADTKIASGGSGYWDGDSFLTLNDAGVLGGPVLQRDPVEVLQVKDRGDGTYGVIGELHIQAGEPKRLVALEYKGTVLRGAAKLYGMSAPTLSGADAAKADVGSVAGTSYGECLTQARFEIEVDATGAADDEITVKVRVTFSAAGDGIDVYVPVDVNPVP